VLVLAAMPYDTEPDPVPLDPVVIVIQDAELTAVHAHPVAVVTCTLRSVTPAVTATLVVDRTAAHVGADCVTEKTRPPIVSVPVRAVFDVLAAIE
jgi:hypothetical protein